MANIQPPRLGPLIGFLIVVGITFLILQPGVLSRGAGIVVALLLLVVGNVLFWKMRTTSNETSKQRTPQQLHFGDPVPDRCRKCGSRLTMQRVGEKEQLLQAEMRTFSVFRCSKCNYEVDVLNGSA